MTHLDKIKDGPFRIRNNSHDRKGLKGLTLTQMSSTGIPGTNFKSTPSQGNNGFIPDPFMRKTTSQWKPQSYTLPMDNQYEDLVGNARAGLAKIDATKKLQQSHNEKMITTSPTKFLNVPKNVKRNFLQRGIKSMNELNIFSCEN